METEIENYLTEIYKLKLEVIYKDFRKYIIKLIFPLATAEINFIYDNKFTFNANMNNLTRFIDNCIIEYFKKEK